MSATVSRSDSYRSNETGVIDVYIHECDLRRREAKTRPEVQSLSPWRRTRVR
jgi:hypothetical protein